MTYTSLQGLIQRFIDGSAKFEMSGTWAHSRGELGRLGDGRGGSLPLGGHAQIFFKMIRVHVHDLSLQFDPHSN